MSMVFPKNIWYYEEYVVYLHWKVKGMGLTLLLSSTIIGGNNYGEIGKMS